MKWLLFLVLISAIFVGCSSLGRTKPNDPYEGLFPGSFDPVAKKNPLLTRELRKLPEFQDGISASESVALDILVDLHKSNTQAFDMTFAKMYQIGIPEVRRYCTPLQAMFWLAQDGKYDELTSSLHDYSLGSLLDNAWDFSFQAYRGKVLDITKKQADEIISNLDMDEQRIYEGITTPRVLNHVILVRYVENPRKFPKKTRKFINDSLKASKHSKFMLRWRQFNTVVERLNAPELVDYYEKRRIHWVDWQTLPTWPVSAGYVFKFGKGDCTAIADFTALCLSKSGFKGCEVKIPPRRSKDKHHSICVFEADGKKFIMDNGSSLQRGIIPYDKNYR